jgi:hypothetical protein
MRYRFWDIENEVEQIRQFTLFHSYVFEGDSYSIKEKTKKAKSLIAVWNRANPRRWEYELIEENDGS